MARLIAPWLLALLSACLPAAGPLQWETMGNLPSDLKVADTVPVGSDAVLVVGYQASSASAGLLARRAYIARFDGSLSTPYAGETGWIQAADAVGLQAWAVHARLKPEGEGSTYELLTSADGGVSWASGGAIPATSLTAITVEGGGCGWALGVNTLLRSCDSGATWATVSTPGCCRAIGQPLAATGPGQATLGGQTLLRTSDGGTTWTQLSDQEVTATDGRFVVAPSPTGVRFGRIDGATVRWTGSFEGELFADRIVSEADRFVVRAAPLGKRAGAGVQLLRSEDAGTTVTTTMLRGGGPTARVGLADPDSTWRIEQSRRLRRGIWR